MKQSTYLAAAIFAMAAAVYTFGQEPPDKSRSPRAASVESVRKYLADIPEPAWQNPTALEREARNIQSLCGGGSLAVRVLGEILADPASEPLRKKVLMVLAALKPEGAQQLFLEILKTGKNDEEKEIALNFLKDAPSDDAMQEIALAVVRPGNVKFQEKASKVVSALVEKNRAQVVKVLCGMVSARGQADEDRIARMAGVIFLGTIPGRDISDLLFRQLENPDAQVRLCVLRAFGARRDAIALDRCFEMMRSDGNLEVRREAGRTVGLIGNESAIPALIDALGDDDEQIRQNALRVLKRMTGQALGPQGGLWELWWEGEQKRLASLFDMLDQNSEDAILRAISALGRERLHKQEISEKIQPFVQHDSVEVQRQAILALGSLGQERSIPALLDALSANNSKTLVAALQSLGKMGYEKEKIIEAVSRFVSDYDDNVSAAACDALGDLGGDSAVGLLLDVISIPDEKHPRRLLSAIRAVGKIGVRDERTVAAIESLIDHEDKAVAAQARAVLTQIKGQQGQTGAE